MRPDLDALLALPVYRAMDVDPAGRVLAAGTERGSLQLVEFAPDGTATELTALPGACSGRYLPGERAVVVAHDRGGDENMQLSLLRLDPPPRQPVGLDGLTPLVHDSRYVHYLAATVPGLVCYVTNSRNGVDFDIMLVDPATGTRTVGYAGGGHVDELALAPDGRRLAYTRYTAQPMSSQLFVTDVGGEPRALTGADEHARCNGPHWYPDGAALMVSSDRGRDRAGIARVDAATGDWRWLVTDDGYDLAGWLSPDGALLLVEANDDGASRLALHDGVTGAWLRDVPLPATGTVSGAGLPGPRWSADSRTVVASIGSVRLPGDALRIDAGTGEVTVLTGSAGPLGGAALVEPQPHRVPAPDGEQIPCHVYRPAPGGDPALAGAAILVIHGGPESQARRGYDPLVQAMAAAGYTVVVPNVRGSIGYGKRWYSLDDGRRRLDSVADLAAIHGYLPALGLDPARAVLWGGSYGGYMVLAGLAFQPALWAAGVDIVGMSSLVTFLENTAAYRRGAREREYGSLAHDRDFLVAASPLSKVDDIRAPLFVIHGANDPRVPVSEAEQLHAALSASGVECELLVYGDEGHGLAKRANRLDAYPKVFGFLARHLTA